MNLAHIHLLLNHFPTVGMIVGLGLLLVSLLGSDDLKRASLVVLLGIALLSIPTYVAGNASQEVICIADNNSAPCTDPGVSKPLILAHENAAFIAMIFMELCGAFAWLGLWQFRRRGYLPKATLFATLLLAITSFGLMAKAANIGGEIRHPEIRVPNESISTEKTFVRKVGSFMGSGVPWGWPTCETLHFVGLSLLFGVAILVDLRVLGMMKSIPFSTLHRLLPWGILGFGLNLVTGMLFFVAASHQYTTNLLFQIKLALILLTGINVLYFTIFDETWLLGPGDDAPITAKIVAATATILVVGVIFCGQMLPFLGNSF